MDPAMKKTKPEKPNQREGKEKNSGVRASKEKG
jgi:hypothetical protein